MPEAVHPLPIDSLLPALTASLQKNPNVIIEATPGAGKTTRVPPALLDRAISKNGEIWVLEPRRIAARLSARRVAEEMGEPLGETVGYQVRFEEISSPRTRLRFLTEGVFTRRMLSNPTLKGVAAVVLDEFHERHLQTDLALALLRRLQQTARPDLKLIVMSATLDAAPLARFLGDCPILQSEGRRFDIAVEFLKQEDSRPLAEQVAAALKKLIAAKLNGDALVFLPGAAEIRRAHDACSAIAARENLLLTLLHGELSTSEQDRAILPAPQRKVILSTNVAETSITIDGVVAVIDSGLARIAEHSPWSGLPTLPIQRISQASAIQRAGRAGRTRTGICLRLFTEMDFTTRRVFETPEIQRLDLAGAALELHAAGIEDLMRFDWFESPGEHAITAADELLQKLGAIKSSGEVTSFGIKMLRYPLHPRAARLLLEAEARGIGTRGALIAVLMSERNLRTRNVSAQPRARAQTTGDSDLSEQEDLFREAQRLRFDSASLQELGIHPGTARAVERAYKQLLRLLERPAADNAIIKEWSDEQIRVAILAGYPDRAARRQESDNDFSVSPSSISNLTLKFANGTSAQLSAESAVRSEYLVAVEATEQSANRSTSTTIRTAIAIEPDWLLDLFPDVIREQNQITWNKDQERVEVMSQMRYDQLVLDERKLDLKNISPELGRGVTDQLFEAARKRGWQHFLDAEEVARLQARIDLMQRTFPQALWPRLTDDELFELLKSSCESKKSFGELHKSLNLDSIAQSLFSYEQLSLLNRMAPEKIQFAGRKNLPVHYEFGQSPWIASRLQDFFGQAVGPKIADGRVPLVLHLLAPNQRPVQITQDLAGFWERTYPQVRRELSRRYPKHSWPEDPRQPQKNYDA